MGAQGHVSSLVYALQSSTVGEGMGGSPSMKTTYKQGDDVMVFSKSRDGWMEAKVTQVHTDGSVDIMYTETRELKQVKAEEQSKTMKKVVTPGAGGYTGGRVSVIEAPVPRRGQNGSEYAVGDVVEVFSDSNQKWLLATVSCIHRDGRCDCKYLYEGTLTPTGTEKQNIPLEMQAKFLRRKG